MDKDKKIAKWFFLAGFIMMIPGIICGIYYATLWIIQMIETREFTPLIIASCFIGLLCLLIGALICSDGDEYDLYY